MLKVAASAVVLLAALAVMDVAAQPVRVCYFTDWAQYRAADATFLPSNVNPALCSHINFAFATINGNTIAAAANDDGTGGLYQQLTGLKAQNPGLKILISVGGGSMAVPTAMMSTSDNRQQFIQSAISFCTSNNFDGIDLDFEFPGSGASPASDKQQFTLLVQEMRAAINAASGNAPLLLTAAVSASQSTIDNGYEIPQITAALDWINLMTYDFHGTWETVTGLNAPLYDPASTLSVDSAVKYWIAGGCPASKVVVGMATYGHAYTLSDPTVNGIGAPAPTPGTQGTYTKTAGILAYYEICDMLKSQGATTVYDPTQKAPYTYVGNQWVGYDNVQSLTEKVNYIQANGCGGWMVWTMDLDDFTGNHCGAGPYPLLNALNTALTGNAPAPA